MVQAGEVDQIISKCEFIVDCKTIEEIYLVIPKRFYWES
jgi:hypothetical protein